jgi:uncharacterized membrane protein YcaP (DUF421 family)
VTDMLLGSWAQLLRTLIVGTLAYITLVLALRVSGKRTLSKLNAFDFIVTVAIGSAFATVLLSSEVGLLEGVAAFVLLSGLQFLVAKASVRWKAFSSLVKSRPALIVEDGRFLPAAMRRERVTEGEVLAALRASGQRSMAETEAVVIETDGTLSVIPIGEGSPDTLRDVRRP